MSFFLNTVSLVLQPLALTAIHVHFTFKTDLSSGKHTVNSFTEAQDVTIRDKSLSSRSLNIWFKCSGQRRIQFHESLLETFRECDISIEQFAFDYVNIIISASHDMNKHQELSFQKLLELPKSNQHCVM